MTQVNNPLSMAELEEVLSTCKNSSPGPNNLPVVMIKHLTKPSKQTLLSLYNIIWSNNVFPDIWKVATVIPISKPGKDHSNPTNFRPISLTCNLGKILEKIVNKRLIWILEKANWLSSAQNGFRKFHSTYHALIPFNDYVSNALHNHKQVVALDIQKAYDMVWKHRMIKILTQLGFHENIIQYIQNFLKDRSIQVKVNDILSSKKEIANGVPQGSVLSVTLFLIAINDIVNCIPAPVQGLLYADDLIIYCSGSQVNNICDLLQEVLNNIVQWCSHSGFQLAENKTEYMVFSNMKKQTTCPHLHINNVLLKQTTHIKLLDMYFDSKLRSNVHIEHLKRKYHQKLSIIRTLASKNWGSDTDILLNVYKALIRSTLDYGAILYNTASKSLLKKLDTIQTSALRLSIGAFRSSPRPSILAEANEIPLDLRRTQLILNFKPSTTHIPPYPRDENNKKSFFSTLIAISLSLNVIKNNQFKKTIICTDSLSSVQALMNPFSDSPMVQECQLKLWNLSKQGEIVIAWVPAHIGIPGNELADSEAKSAI
ncbi:GSCOCG00011700001-RA-CDS, partial [Cotesia congregata]